MDYSCYDYILNQIHDSKIRNFTVEVLKACPKELETMPASTSGKYHPIEACQKGGLVFHVRRACWFASQFFHAYGWDEREIKADVVLSALLLHDICKKEKYGPGDSYINHPVSAALFIEKFKEILPENVFKAIKGAIINHMGRWTPKSHLKPIEKYTLIEMLVYQCDYLSSKRELEVKKG